MGIPIGKLHSDIGNTWPRRGSARETQGRSTIRRYQ
jgi:hypothetical protein